MADEVGEERRLTKIETLLEVTRSEMAIVRERTHTFASTLTETALMAEEAYKQRVELLSRQSSIEDKVHAVGVNLQNALGSFNSHVRTCNARSSRLERLAWATGFGVLSILAYLIKYIFEHPFH